MHNVQ